MYVVVVYVYRYTEKIQPTYYIDHSMNFSPMHITVIDLDDVCENVRL